MPKAVYWRGFSSATRNRSTAARLVIACAVGANQPRLRCVLFDQPLDRARRDPCQVAAHDHRSAPRGAAEKRLNVADCDRSGHTHDLAVRVLRFWLARRSLLERVGNYDAGTRAPLCAQMLANLLAGAARERKFSGHEQLARRSSADGRQCLVLGGGLWRLNLL
jgi:hypothetical protein